MDDVLNKLAREIGFDDIEDMYILVNRLRQSVSDEEFNEWKYNHQSKETLLYLLEKDSIVSH